MGQRERKDFPLTDDEVLALLNWQTNDFVHPFTCKTHSQVALFPTNHSWLCPVQGCKYRQFWCNENMLKPVDPPQYRNDRHRNDRTDYEHESGVSSGIPDHLIKRDR